jgi:hypothetical protein
MGKGASSSARHSKLSPRHNARLVSSFIFVLPFPTFSPSTFLDKALADELLNCKAVALHD